MDPELQSFKTVLQDGAFEDFKVVRALVGNALLHLDLLRSTVHDGLTGANDSMLKISLLYDLGEAERNLRKALV